MALKIWDASSGRFVRSLPHVDATCVVFSSDGKYLASSGGQCFVRGKVKLWDTATWEELPIFPVVTGWSSSVAFHPDGTRLAVASGELENSNRVSILEIGTGKRLGFIDGDVGGVLSVEFSPDGKRIATACGHMDTSAVETEPSIALIRDAVTLEVLQRLEGHTEPLTSVAFSPDGTKLATSSLDLTVRVWDAASAKEIRKLIGHGRRPNKVVFSPNGKWLAAGTDGTSITVWEVETGKEINWIRGHTAEVYGLAFHPDSRRLGVFEQRHRQGLGRRADQRRFDASRSRRMGQQGGVQPRREIDRDVEHRSNDQGLGLGRSDGVCTRSRVTPSRSLRWPSVQTEPLSPPGEGTGNISIERARSGSGTWLPEKRYGRSTPTWAWLERWRSAPMAGNSPRLGGSAPLSQPSGSGT